MRHPESPQRLFAALAVAAAAASGCRPGYRPVAAVHPTAAGAVRPSADAAARHIRVLADPKRGGRMTCTPGNAFAREYIARQFAAIGLAPGGQDDGWFQSFRVDAMRAAGPRNALRVSDRNPLVLFDDFAPVAAGCSGRFDGQGVFVGHGEQADYAGADVRGKVVLMLRGTHRGVGRKSIWWNKRPALRDALVAAKLKRAARAGAAAVLMVTPSGIAVECDPLDSVIGRGRGRLPAIRVSRRVARADSRVRQRREDAW